MTREGVEEGWRATDAPHPHPAASSGGTGRWRARRLFSGGGPWSQQRTHGRSLRGLGYWPLRVLVLKSHRAKSTPALGNFLHGERQAPTSVSDRKQARPGSVLLFVWRRDWMFPLCYQQGEERGGRGKVPGIGKGNLTLDQPIENTLGTDYKGRGRALGITALPGSSVPAQEGLQSTF